MADTYHPQQQFAVGRPDNIWTTGTGQPAIEMHAYTQDMDLIIATGSFIPANQGLIVEMELYAPGGGTTWPDNLKPQYRVPSFATAPYVPPFVADDFPAMLLAP